MAFLDGGASVVVASLFETESLIFTELTAMVLRDLTKTKDQPAVALRRVQLELLKRIEAEKDKEARPPGALLLIFHDVRMSEKNNGQCWVKAAPLIAQGARSPLSLCQVR